MAVIVVVCATFRFIISDAKTDTMCLCTKGMPEPIAVFNIEGVIPGVQPNE